MHVIHTPALTRRRRHRHQFTVCAGELVMFAVMPGKRKRDTLAKLLEGVTPKLVKLLNNDASQSQKVEPFGPKLV